MKERGERSAVRSARDTPCQERDRERRSWRSDAEEELSARKRRVEMRIEQERMEGGLELEDGGRRV